MPLPSKLLNTASMKSGGGVMKQKGFMIWVKVVVNRYFLNPEFAQHHPGDSGP